MECDMFLVKNSIFQKIKNHSHLNQIKAQKCTINTFK